MHSRVPRAATRVRAGGLPSDRTPDRTASKRVSKEDGSSYARPRHLSAEERALKDAAWADAHGNLAAMCFERAGVDLTADPDEIKAAAEAVAGKRDFLLLADILGLDGAR